MADGIEGLKDASGDSDLLLAFDFRSLGS